MLAKPNATPMQCGSVARSPKLAPVTAAMVVLGPGVNAPTASSVINARNWAIDRPVSQLASMTATSGQRGGS